MKSGLYTIEEDRLIAKAYSENMPIKKLCKLLNRNENSVMSRVRKLKVIRCFDNDCPFEFNWNPKSFSMRGKAKLQNAIYKRGMDL